MRSSVTYSLSSSSGSSSRSTDTSTASMPVIRRPPSMRMFSGHSPCGRLAEEGDGEGQPVVTDLDGVHAAELRGPYLGAPAVRTADQLLARTAHAGPLPSNTSSRRLAVERTT